jgi:hypothetical protein
MIVFINIPRSPSEYSAALTRNRRRLHQRAIMEDFQTMHGVSPHSPEYARFRRERFNRLSCRPV